MESPLVSDVHLESFSGSYFSLLKENTPVRQTIFPHKFREIL